MSEIADEVGKTVGNTSKNMVITVSKTGVKISAKVGKNFSQASLRILLATVLAALKEIPVVKNIAQGAKQSLAHGKMSVKNLQQQAGGDLHPIAVSPEMIKNLQRDLKRRGIDFAVETGADKQTYVHFKGSDADTIQHAISQAKATLEKNREEKQTPEAPENKEKPENKKTPPQERKDLSTKIKERTEEKKKNRKFAQSGKKRPSPKKTSPGL